MSLFLFALVHVWRGVGTLVAPAAAKRKVRARLSPAAAEKFFRLAIKSDGKIAPDYCVTEGVKDISDNEEREKAQEVARKRSSGSN